MFRVRPLAWLGIAATLSTLLLGCALSASGTRALDALVSEHGMTRMLVEGRGFQHLVLIRGDLLSASRLHVYLEGDGLPWSSRHRVSLDPGPMDPFALRLMAQDPLPSIYVGRPCYHGFAQSEGCSPWIWTSGRYSPQVVESMTEALLRVLHSSGRHPLTLIGYSGGGVIGFLMAERLADVDHLVTVAANLDIDAWSDGHGYSRLAGSLNPAKRFPLAARIRQTHLLGENDDIVPSMTIAAFRAANPQAAFRVLSGYGHRCCWSEDWTRLLAEMR